MIPSSNKQPFKLQEFKGFLEDYTQKHVWGPKTQQVHPIRAPVKIQTPIKAPVATSTTRCGLWRTYASDIFGLWRVRFPPVLVQVSLRTGRRLPVTVQALGVFGGESLGFSVTSRMSAVAASVEKEKIGRCCDANV